MKKIFATLFAAMMLSVSVSAQLITLGSASYGYATATLAATNGGFHLISTNPIEVVEIQAVGSSGAANALGFYDDPYGNGKWTNAAYTSRLSYTTNVSLTHTNAEGIIETNTYTGVLWTTTATTAAATNNYTAITTLAVPVSGTATRIGKFDFSRGLTIYTTTNCDISISYRRLY